VLQGVLTEGNLPGTLALVRLECQGFPVSLINAAASVIWSSRVPVSIDALREIRSCLDSAAISSAPRLAKDSAETGPGR
jgi:hypothetical protein